MRNYVAVDFRQHPLQPTWFTTRTNPSYCACHGIQLFESCGQLLVVTSDVRGVFT